MHWFENTKIEKYNITLLSLSCFEKYIVFKGTTCISYKFFKPYTFNSKEVSGSISYILFKYT